MIKAKVCLKELDGRTKRKIEVKVYSNLVDRMLKVKVCSKESDGRTKRKIVVKVYSSR